MIEQGREIPSAWNRGRRARRSLLPAPPRGGLGSPAQTDLPLGAETLATETEKGATAHRCRRTLFTSLQKQEAYRHGRPMERV